MNWLFYLLAALLVWFFIGCVVLATIDDEAGSLFAWASSCPIPGGYVLTVMAWPIILYFRSEDEMTEIQKGGVMPAMNPESGTVMYRPCWCLKCRPQTMNTKRFVCCPGCGNKRCPRASDHRNACTNSNAVGQVATPVTPDKAAQVDEMEAMVEIALDAYSRTSWHTPSRPAMRAALLATGLMADRAELVALRAVIDAAPVADITAGYDGPSVAFPASDNDDMMMSGMVGQRVLLLPASARKESDARHSTP